MSKLNLPTQFFFLLALVLLVSFGVHILILSSKDLPLFANLVIRSYVVNALLAAIIFLLLYRFREKLKNQIGFLFMGGSFLKFIFFFLLFYPTYKSDGDMSSLEFASFFVPYLACLFLETFFTSKMLKNLEGSSK
jgi:drug/metabolite transporter (DMT)-like permease